MRIYTRTGDTGNTSLFTGERVRKDHRRVEAYGTVDELNSLIGVVRATLDDPEVDSLLRRIQSELLDLGAELATTARRGAAGRARRVPRVGPERVAALEAAIDHYQAGLPPLTRFILPGGGQAGALLHLARTVARRAERRAVTLAAGAAVNDSVIQYLNRLSDLFFVLARAVNRRLGRPEEEWSPGGQPPPPAEV